MCGIAGIIQYKTQVDAGDISKLNQSLSHRGPDGDGVWLNEERSLALVHRRLSILDLSAAASQPMHSAEGRFVMIYNGEIYNFLEVRNELVKKGYVFKTESDSEVLLAAYAEWKEHFVSKLNGMWALAIYDRQEKSLFLSRDRYGVKPLYYFNNGSRFIFASEIQAIQKVLGRATVLNDAVLSDLARSIPSFHGTTETYLKNVFSLPGGYNLLCGDGRIEIKKWYELQKTEVPHTLEDQAAEFLRLLTDACRIRLRSDVAVATCLSGGVDSGSITSIIHSFNLDASEKRFNHYSHESFLASFPGTQLDERLAAESLSANIGNKLHVLEVNAPTAGQMEEAMSACDGPMHSLAFYPIWLLYRFIRSHGIKVTLDGQGPDEMLGGYRPLQEGLRASWQAKDFSWMKEIYDAYSLQGESQQFSSRDYARNEVKEFIKQGLKKVIGYKSPAALHSVSHAVRNEKQFSNALEESLYRQFFYNPLPSILNQYDRCSMASGVECRMPFMDYRLVEFVFSLPTKSKVGKGFTKLVLREAMKGILPEQTRTNRVKIGFNAPMAEWIRGSLKPFMADIINSKEFETSPYFDAAKLRASFKAYFEKNNQGFLDAYYLYPAVHLTWWLKKNGLS
jgi:asparagine synthase (glutamine-hydrolysing)